MRVLNLDEIQQVSAGQRLSPLLAVGVASSVAHQLNDAIAGKNVSATTLLRVAITNLAAAPLIARDAAAPTRPLQIVATMIYLDGLRSYLQMLLSSGSTDACERPDPADLVY